MAPGKDHFERVGASAAVDRATDSGREVRISGVAGNQQVVGAAEGDIALNGPATAVDAATGLQAEGRVDDDVARDRAAVGEVQRFTGNNGRIAYAGNDAAGRICNLNPRRVYSGARASVEQGSAVGDLIGRGRIGQCGHSIG